MASLAPRHASLLLILVGLATACSSDNGGPGGDQPTSIAINGGNIQAVRYGNPVPNAPSVVVTNAKGPMQGVAVTFTVVAGGGSVTGATTTTDAQGVATVGSWTLGPTPGPNTLRATAGTISININATAITGPPTTITIEAGNNQTWVQGSQVPTPPSVLVTDGQFPVPNVTVLFTVASGGGSVSLPQQKTSSNGTAAPGGWRLGAATTNTLNASVQNSSITPVTFTATAQPLVISAVNKTDGDNQSGFAGNFAGRKPTLTVLNQFGQPTEGVLVAFSTSSGTSASGPITTDLSGQAQLPWWRFGGAGPQTVTATAGSAAPVIFSATATTVPASSYHINVFYPTSPGVTAPSNAIKAIFDSAVARWQSVIVDSLPSIVLSGTNVIGPSTVNTGPPPGIGVIPCIPQVSNTTIKDVNIYVYIRPIDGTSGSNILGLATPVYFRSGSLLPYAGCMVFDEENIDQLLSSGGLYSVILHEMGHVFGFGTIWDEKNLLVGACPASNTPAFVGPSSQEAFVAALVTGGVYNDPITPVEGAGQCNDGTRDGHWSESVMGNELMTGFLGTTNPLSAITSASLRDLGYGVNDAVSDPYTVPSVSAALRMGAAMADRIHELHAPSPIIVTDTRGRTTQIIDR